MGNAASAVSKGIRAAERFTAEQIGEGVVFLGKGVERAGEKFVKSAEDFGSDVYHGRIGDALSDVGTFAKSIDEMSLGLTTMFNPVGLIARGIDLTTDLVKGRNPLHHLREDLRAFGGEYGRVADDAIQVGVDIDKGVSVGGAFGKFGLELAGDALTVATFVVGGEGAPITDALVSEVSGNLIKEIAEAEGKELTETVMKRLLDNSLKDVGTEAEQESLRRVFTNKTKSLFLKNGGSETLSKRVLMEGSPTKVSEVLGKVARVKNAVFNSGKIVSKPVQKVADVVGGVANKALTKAGVTTAVDNFITKSVRYTLPRIRAVLEAISLTGQVFDDLEEESFVEEIEALTEVINTPVDSAAYIKERMVKMTNINVADFIMDKIDAKLSPVESAHLRKLRNGETWRSVLRSYKEKKKIGAFGPTDLDKKGDNHVKMPDNSIVNLPKSIKPLTATNVKKLNTMGKRGTAIVTEYAIFRQQYNNAVKHPELPFPVPSALLQSALGEDFTKLWPLWRQALKVKGREIAQVTEQTYQRNLTEEETRSMIIRNTIDQKKGQMSLGGYVPLITGYSDGGNTYTYVHQNNMTNTQIRKMQIRSVTDLHMREWIYIWRGRGVQNLSPAEVSKMRHYKDVLISHHPELKDIYYPPTTTTKTTKTNTTPPPPAVDTSKSTPATIPSTTISPGDVRNQSPFSTGIQLGPLTSVNENVVAMDTSSS